MKWKCEKIKTLFWLITTSTGELKLELCTNLHQCHHVDKDLLFTVTNHIQQQDNNLRNESAMAVHQIGKSNIKS